MSINLSDCPLSHAHSVLRAILSPCHGGKCRNCVAVGVASDGSSPTASSGPGSPEKRPLSPAGSLSGPNLMRRAFWKGRHSMDGEDGIPSMHRHRSDRYQSFSEESPSLDGGQQLPAVPELPLKEVMDAAASSSAHVPEVCLLKGKRMLCCHPG